MSVQTCINDLRSLGVIVAAQNDKPLDIVLAENKLTGNRGTVNSKIRKLISNIQHLQGNLKSEHISQGDNGSVDSLSVWESDTLLLEFIAKTIHPKASKYGEVVDNLFYEYTVGWCLNSMISKLPFWLVGVYGAFNPDTYKYVLPGTYEGILIAGSLIMSRKQQRLVSFVEDRPGQMFKMFQPVTVVYEKVPDGKTFYKVFTDSENASCADLVRTSTLVALGLVLLNGREESSIAYPGSFRLRSFVHNDLHTDNIMLVDLSKYGYYAEVLVETPHRMETFVSRFVPFFIDYGRTEVSPCYTDLVEGMSSARVVQSSHGDVGVQRSDFQLFIIFLIEVLEDMTKEGEHEDRRNVIEMCTKLLNSWLKHDIKVFEPTFKYGEHQFYRELPQYREDIHISLVDAMQLLLSDQQKAGADYRNEGLRKITYTIDSTLKNDYTIRLE